MDALSFILISLVLFLAILPSLSIFSFALYVLNIPCEVKLAGVYYLTRILDGWHASQEEREVWIRRNMFGDL
jgi:hypothetical protein